MKISVRSRELSSMLVLISSGKRYRTVIGVTIVSAGKVLGSSSPGMNGSFSAPGQTRTYAGFKCLLAEAKIYLDGSTRLGRMVVGSFPGEDELTLLAGEVSC